MPSAKPALPTVEVLAGGYDFATDQGVPAFCGVFLIEGPDATGRPARILVDPAHVGRRRLLLERLAARGLEPADIDAVLLTHAHWDHMQNVDLFEGAPLLMHADERRYASRPHRHDWATPKWTGLILERLKIEEVGEGSEVIPGVTIIDLPGHSPGSLGVIVDAAEGRALIAGDAVHNASVLGTGQPPLIFWDVAQARRSVKRVARSAEIVYPGHDRPFKLTRGGAIEYLTPFRLTITGLAGDVRGLRFQPQPAEAWVMPGIEEQSLARG
ncbi:MAG: MBL fold metallo-hydrolase [Candidatus Dormibacteraceae bacterium]